MKKNKRTSLLILAGVLLILVVLGLVAAKLAGGYLDRKLDKISYTPTGTYVHRGTSLRPPSRVKASATCRSLMRSSSS